MEWQEFIMCVQTLGFGFLLSLFDVGSDIASTAQYLATGHYWWGALTFGLVLLPGLVLGFSEVVIGTIKGRNSVIFGLEALPSLKIKRPPAKYGIFWMPPCLVAMALLFPIMPLAQYIRLFQLQRSQPRRPNGGLEAQDQIYTETKKAVHFKA